MQKILSDNRRILFFFLILSFLFYGSSIKNGFSLDDSYVTVTNYPVKGQNYIPNHQLVSGGFKNIPKIWRSHYGHGNGTSYDYRPLVITMFAIEYSIFGQSPHINHIINIILYGFLVFLLFILLKKCFASYSYNESFAFICSIFFLAHPIHTEVVNNIKCRDELLALIFNLLGSIFIIRFYEHEQKKFILLSIMFMLLGLYTKLTAAIFVGLIPLMLFFFFRMDKKNMLFILIVLFLCYRLYMRTKNALITEKVSRAFFHFENPLYTEHISFYERILFALKIFGSYIKLLIFPYPLRCYYGCAIYTSHVNMPDFEIILGILFVIGAFYYWYKSKNKIALFGLLFFLISIAPLTNLIQPVAGVVGERLCLTASIGFIILITSFVFSFYKAIPNKITTQLLMQKPLVYLNGILLVCLFYTWNRNNAWESEFSLFEHDAQYSEKSSGINNLLGNKYFEMLNAGDFKKYSQSSLITNALKHYNLAIKDDSIMYSAYNNTGVLYFSYLNQRDLALTYFKMATRFKPDYAQAYENIGNYYDKKGDFIQAFKNYRIAITNNPQQYQSYTALITLLVKKNLMLAAFPIVKEADRNFPKDYFITSQYANYLLMTGDTLPGMQKLEDAYKIYPNKKLAKFLFGKCYELKYLEKAEYYKNQYAILPQ